MAAAAERRASGTDGGDLAALPEELLHEVFSRVGGVKELFQLAVTCRRWLRLFTDPSFLRELYRGQGQGHRARLLGFFPLPARLGDRCPSSMARMRMARTSVSPSTFLLAPGSPLGPTERALTSFVAAADGTFNYAEPLAARRGVVLMQLAVSPLQLGLFNPTTCERHVLPPLVECSSDSSWCVDGYAIIMAADGGADHNHRGTGTIQRSTFWERAFGTGTRERNRSHSVKIASKTWFRFPVRRSSICRSGNSGDYGADHDGPSPPPPSGRFTFSQLLLITTRPGSYQRYLHSYSAATRTWGRAPTPFLDGRCLYLVGEGPAAVHHGAAHWLMCDGLTENKRAPQGYCSLSKLSVELGGGGRTTRVSLAKLPVPGRPCVTPLLHVSRDGKLSVACMSPAHVTVWTQQDDAAWVRTQVFLIPMVAAPHPTPTDSPGWLHSWSDEWHEFGRGSVLVLGKCCGVLVLDLEKEVMEKVMDCFPRLYDGREIRKCVPYEMDLVDFFVSRLGNLLCRG